MESVILKMRCEKFSLKIDFFNFQAFHEDGARIEAAFRKYIHRADVEQKNDSVEIIVCHANVIRYFVCRALQLPAEGEFDWEFVAK
jgi:hypothetical protein